MKQKENESTKDLVKDIFNPDSFFEQATQITKAHAYDILAEHNKQLQHEIDILKIELKAANAMLKAYEGFVNDIPDTLFNK